MQLWKTLSVSRVSDIFSSNSPSIVAVKRDKGEIVAQALVTIFIDDLLEHFNVIRGMTKPQVAQCVTIIMDKYYYWKPEDFKYCFDRVLFGDYGQDGKVLDRIDTATILKWMGIHDQERFAEAQAANDKKHEEMKSGKTLVVHEKILEAFKTAIPAGDAHSNILPPMKPTRLMSPFELELHKHFKAFDDIFKDDNFEFMRVSKPGDAIKIIKFEGKEMDAPTYVQMMITKTTGKTL